MTTSPELVPEITAIVHNSPGLRVLEPEESSSLAERVAAAFITDSSRRWWWGALNSEARTIDYEGGQGLEILDKAMSAVQGTIWMFVTDNKFSPWMVVSGQWDGLHYLIYESRFFEFFLVDESLSWIVFDTHHNQLVFGGNHPSMEASHE